VEMEAHVGFESAAGKRRNDNIAGGGRARGAVVLGQKRDDAGGGVQKSKQVGRDRACILRGVENVLQTGEQIVSEGLAFRNFASLLVQERYLRGGVERRIDAAL